MALLLRPAIITWRGDIEDTKTQALETRARSTRSRPSRSVM